VARALAAVTTAARDRENVMPALVEAVDASASIGEIASSLVVVFGEYREGAKL
jgi:methylmalonyl-CoA mutase N-terminal domain/subunit